MLKCSNVETSFTHQSSHAGFSAEVGKYSLSASAQISRVSDKKSHQYFENSFTSDLFSHLPKIQGVETLLPSFLHMPSDLLQFNVKSFVFLIVWSLWSG